MSYYYFYVVLLLFMSCRATDGDLVTKNDREQTKTSPSEEDNKDEPPPDTKSEEDNKDEPPPDTKNESTLVEYLKAKSIAPDVEKLALIGVNNYLKPGSVLKARRTPPSTGAGRKKDFIVKTFDKTEDELLLSLKGIAAPQTWSVSDINDVFNAYLRKHPKDAAQQKAPFVLVKGVNVNYLHEAPLGKDSVLQLASQFNYLESPGPYVTSVSSYLNDYTQGPMGSIEALAAALHRTAAVKGGKLLPALSQVLPAQHDAYYRHGYLELFKLSEADAELLKKHIETNILNLAILPQWAINEASGATQLQIFSAAPSFQGVPTPSINSSYGAICDLLVGTQYESIAKLAVIRSILTEKPVAVHLTLVGQGAFSNPPEVMHNALRRVAQIVVGYPRVRVFVHAYNKTAQENVRQQIDGQVIRLTEMDAAVFMTATF